MRRVCRGYDPRAFDPRGYGFRGHDPHGYDLRAYEHRVQRPDAHAECLPTCWKQSATAQEGLILQLSKCEVLFSYFGQILSTYKI